MSKSIISEDYKSLSLPFCGNFNLVIVPTINDGNCYFHAILRAFNESYIGAKTTFDRINLARTLRNMLADRLIETDPITGQDYYNGLLNGTIEQYARGAQEYSKENLRKELLSSHPVDNIYQELISNFFNKDIYIIDGETRDIYHIDNFNVYYKGRNSIVIYYNAGHFEVLGVKRSNGNIETLFTPEHPLIELCRNRLIEEIKNNREKNSATPRAMSPKITAISSSSPRK